jgi:hypothetical protein
LLSHTRGMSHEFLARSFNGEDARLSTRRSGFDSPSGRMSACCQFVSHLWSLIAHHSGHRPKVSQEALANLTLYSTARRQVKAEPRKDR